MHEFSLVESLLQQVDDLIVEHDGIGVEVIRVEMGPFSGVERTLVELAFEQLVETTSCAGARLVIDEVPLTARCMDCCAMFTIERFRFVCPQCHSQQVQVAGGDEFRLMEVEITAADDPPVKPHEEMCCEVRT